MVFVIRQYLRFLVVAISLLGVFVLPFNISVENVHAMHADHEVDQMSDCDGNGCPVTSANAACLEHCLSSVDGDVAIVMPASPRITVAQVPKRRLQLSAFHIPVSQQITRQVRIRDSIPILIFKKRE